MPNLPQLFANNAAWAARQVAADPDFFARLQKQQAPEYLWIGCADSRVPANEIVGLAPGEMFVHRNVANVVSHTDFNCLSVLQYALDALKVKHVIITGHYGCGGVRAVCDGARLGLIDNWLRRVDHVRRRYQDRLQALPPEAAVDRLCELNVIEQARNACETTIVQDAWARGQSVVVHGWIYGLGDGRLRDLNFLARRPDDIASAYDTAVAEALAARGAGMRAPA